MVLLRLPLVLVFHLLGCDYSQASPVFVLPLLGYGFSWATPRFGLAFAGLWLCKGYPRSLSYDCWAVVVHMLPPRLGLTFARL